MCMLLSLFIEVISLTSFVVDVFLEPDFEFSVSDRYTRKFQKIRYSMSAMK